MVPGYSLRTSEYRHPREIIVMYTYLGIGAIAFLFLMAYNFILAIQILVGIGVFFVTIFLALRQNLANCVRISSSQFPEIYRLGVEAADRLDIPMPHIYIKQSPILNAFSQGFGRSFNIVLHSALVDALSSKELLYVIGHEMGHIKGNHLIWFNVTATGLSNPIIAAVLAPIRMVLGYLLMFLSRFQEYSSDRAGLIACGNIYNAISATTKLAVGKEMFERINFKEYFSQIQEYRSEKVNFFAELQADHPFIVNRIRALVQFYQSREYKSVMGKLGEGYTSLLEEPNQGTIQLLNKIVDKYHNQQGAPAANNQLVDGRPVLRGIAGYYAGVTLELGPKSIAIGRDPQFCQLIFPSSHNGISRQHCILRIDKGNYNFILEDRSSNGTFLATGEQVKPGGYRILKSGDRFYVGDPSNLFEVRLEA